MYTAQKYILGITFLRHREIPKRARIIAKFHMYVGVLECPGSNSRNIRVKLTCPRQRGLAKLTYPQNESNLGIGGSMDIFMTMVLNITNHFD